MKFYIGSGLKNCELVNYVSEKLINSNHKHTYNWAKNIIGNETINHLIQFSRSEIQGIKEAEVVIILLPAGRGTHIELGIALALNKKIYLYSEMGKDFDVENTVNFYQIPNIVRLVGNIDDCIEKIIREEEK